MGLGPIVLGYADDGVNRAAREQLDKGTLFGLPSSLELDVAEKLIEFFSCAEGVRFGKNRADATPSPNSECLNPTRWHDQRGMWAAVSARFHATKPFRSTS